MTREVYCDDIADGITCGRFETYEKALATAYRLAKKFYRIHLRNRGELVEGTIETLLAERIELMKKENERKNNCSRGEIKIFEPED